MENEILLSLPELENDMYEPILGNKIYNIYYYDIENNSYENTYTSNEFMIPLKSELYEIKIEETYEKNTSIHGDAYIISSF